MLVVVLGSIQKYGFNVEVLSEMSLDFQIVLRVLNSCLYNVACPAIHSYYTSQVCEVVDLL